MRVAAPIRVLLAASRGLTHLFRVFEAVRDEVLIACVPPDKRDAVTAAAYSRAREFLPKGAVFEQGLFSWERALLARPEMPRHGRVLVAGAGGGREVKALVERGYEVFAFEPAAELCEACRGILGHHSTDHVAQGTYRDLVRAVDGDGPLAGFAGPFDLVWLGWGSFSHITATDDHAAVLAAIKSLAPDAPVVSSFFLRRPTSAPEGGISRLRGGLKRMLGLVGGRKESSAVEFWPSVGFTYTFDEAELRSLFRACGYSIAVFEPDPYPHALIAPETARVVAAGAGKRLA